MSLGWIWLWAASRLLEQEKWHCTRECIHFSTNSENVDLLGKIWNRQSLSKTKNPEKAFERLFMDLALSGWIMILHILDWVMLMFPWKWWVPKPYSSEVSWKCWLYEEPNFQLLSNIVSQSNRSIQWGLSGSAQWNHRKCPN